MSELIYSRWRPDRGGYDYFAAPGSQNINDDLPQPDLSPATKIGVPSIEAGRPVPSGAVRAGSGDEPRGMIAPVDSSRIVRRTRSLGATTMTGMGLGPAFWLTFVGLAAGTFVVWKVLDGRPSR
jgi:hypothetical protein